VALALRCGVPLHGNGKSAKVSGLLNKQINLIAVQYFFLDIIDLESVLEDFTSKNVRRRFFKKH